MSTTVLDDDPMLTLRQVAKHLNVTPGGLHNRRRRGESVPPFKLVAGKLQIRQSVYLAWLDEQAKADQ